MIAGAILIINKQFIKPIHKITLGLQSIKDGFLSEQHTIADKDLVPEINNLAQGYNQFLDLLKVKEKQEEALKVSEERYDLAMKGSNDGVWDWDLKKEYLLLFPPLENHIGIYGRINPQFSYGMVFTCACR